MSSPLLYVAGGMGIALASGIVTERGSDWNGRGVVGGANRISGEVFGGTASPTNGLGS